MLGFSPFKKHANKFNYIPRYYDPEAERRAERRAELRGERPEDAGREYEPGRYLRTARTARAARREEERRMRSKRRFGMLLMGAVVLLLVFAALYPRVTALIDRAERGTAPAAVQTHVRTSELDQSGIDDVQWQQQQITVVPNDYREE